MRKKWCLFESDSSFDPLRLALALNINVKDIEFFDSCRGRIPFPGDFRALETDIENVKQRIPSNFGFLICRRKGEFEMSLLNRALATKPFEICFPDDIVLSDISRGRFELFRGLRESLKKLTPVDIYTVKTLLKFDCSVGKTVDYLSLHRNTILCREKSLLRRADYDFRDHHDLSLIQIYIDLSGK